MAIESRTSKKLTWLEVMPTDRTQKKTRTRTVVWLASTVPVRSQPRSCTVWLAWSRKWSTARSTWSDAGLWRKCNTQFRVLSPQRPSRWALASLRNTSHSTSPNTAMTSTPSRAAPTVPAVLWPARTTRTTATMGNPSLNAKIQTPVVPTAVETATFENPKLPNIRKVIPTATAPPAGTVFEMAEDVWVSKNPCR